MHPSTTPGHFLNQHNSGRPIHFRFILRKGWETTSLNIRVIPEGRRARASIASELDNADSPEISNFYPVQAWGQSHDNWLTTESARRPKVVPTLAHRSGHSGCADAFPSAFRPLTGLRLCLGRRSHPQVVFFGTGRPGSRFAWRGQKPLYRAVRLAGSDRATPPPPSVPLKLCSSLCFPCF
jgi:hypothetical protein